MPVIPSGTHLRDAPPAAIAAGTAIDHARLAAVAVERTRMAMCVSDPQQPDNPIVLANRAFLNQTGYTADEVIGRNCRFLQGPETDPDAVERIRRALAEQTDLTIELLNYRRDGSPFWNRLLISPITDDAGNLLYYFASQMDVTAERRARDLAEREHILLREVDHRAKNALALVQGIVRLSCADDANAYSSSIQGRVEALAQAHIILSDAAWHDVPLGRLATAATTHFNHRQVAASGPAVDIAAAHVQPLLLAFHEMMSNAAQHGALSAPAGSVKLGWHLDGERLVVDLTERGGPPSTEPTRQGYGLKMVDAFIGRQLRGTVERDWHRDGLSTRLTFPHRPLAVARAA